MIKIKVQLPVQQNINATVETPIQKTASSKVNLNFSDHSKLIKRSKPDQHPIEAITGLGEALENIEQTLEQKADSEDVYTKQEVGQLIADIPTPDVSGQISAHNTSEAAHSDIRTSLGNKVDKVSGKDLISVSEITRLASVDNYDDSALIEAINAKQDALGFTPEDVANKITTFAKTPNDTQYPSAKLLKDNLDLKANLSGADFTGNISALNLSGTNTGDETNLTIKTKLGTDLTNKALDSAVVHNSGNETVAGVKNFTDNQTGANISQLNTGLCDTAQATVLKEVTLEGYVPKQGDTVKVLMTNASVANATIRFNGGTTYTIRNASSATSTSSWGANSICEFLLDGTYAFLVSVKPADSTTQPSFYGNASSANTSTFSTYSTGGIISVNTLSDTNINTDKWAHFGYFTLTYNSTYSRGMSINHCFLFSEYSRLNSDVSVNDLEAFQVQVKVNLEGVTSSSLFNSAVPNIAINITGKTNLTTNDFCALVYSTTKSAKVIRLYVKLKTPNKHYGFLPICYGNNAYSSTGAISTSYISWTSASVQALISDLPTPAQGTIVYPTFPMIFNSVGAAIFSGDIFANNLPTEWLELSLSADYDATLMSSGDIIPFDKVAGNIVYDPDSREIILTEGKHYDIYISVQHIAKDAGSTLLVSLLDINTGSPVRSVSNARCYAYSEGSKRSNGNAVYRIQASGRLVYKLVVEEIKSVENITAERTLLYIREVQA